MKRLLSDVRLLVPLATALGVASVALIDARRTPPGPLSAVHAQVESLSGGRSCAACHGRFGTSMGEACLRCHERIEAQLESGTGLHGRMGRAAGMGCAGCHSEHHGAGFALVNRRSFRAWGFAEIADFDHAAVGLELSGRHLELACSACHPHAEARLLLEGETRFLGLDRSCQACHEDPHQGRMGRGCESCHDQRSFEQLSFAGHEAWLALDGGHAGQSCRQCHAADGPHALEGAGSRARPRAARGCLHCHDSPHARSFLDGTGSELGLAAEASCASCHAVAHASFRSGSLALDEARHAASGFSLDLPHQGLACERCHPAAAGDFAARHPGRRAEDCAACHADPHGGQFEDGAFGGGCLACHERTHFEPHAFSRQQHARTAFALEGSHAALACADCHPRPHEGAPRAFRGTSGDCSACHADAHQGYFEVRAVEIGARAPQGCGECHLSTRFEELRPGGFDHARSTGFDLRGAHLEEGCQACHRPSELRDERGRRFGPVPAHYHRELACASCHADPHRGAFDGPPLPETIDGRAGCARCHEETSFRSLPHGFDHGLATGFTLDGAHARAACSACHPRRPLESGRSRPPVRGQACADCHQDPHAGQFASRGPQGCGDCHAVGQGFAQLVFDHDRHSRFRLDEAHAGLRCAACHPTFEREGRSVTHFRPLGTECASCHGDQRRPLWREGGRPR